MKQSEFLTKIKTISGATNAELIIVSIVLGGFLMGLIIQSFQIDAESAKVNPEVFRILDSLAEQSRQKYVGTDEMNNPAIFQENASDSLIIETTANSRNTISDSKATKADKLKGMKINLNSASKAELMKLPNVGEKTAIAIIEYRNRKPFNHPSELKNIKGIGDKKYDTMKDFIEVK